MGEFFGMLIVVLVLFLIGREIMMWYWKINDIVKLLQSINKKLDNLNKEAPLQKEESIM